MAFTQIGCSSSYKMTICPRNPSPKTMSINNDVTHVEDGFSTNDYGIKPNSWECSDLKTDLTLNEALSNNQQYQQELLNVPFITSQHKPYQNLGYTGKNFPNNLQHSNREMKEPDKNELNNLEVFSSDRLTHSLNYSTPTSLYHHHDHHHDQDHHHHQQQQQQYANHLNYPSNYQKTNYNLYHQPNNDPVLHSSIPIDLHESSIYFRQPKEMNNNTSEIIISNYSEQEIIENKFLSNGNIPNSLDHLSNSSKSTSITTSTTTTTSPSSSAAGVAAAAASRASMELHIGEMNEVHSDQYGNLSTDFHLIHKNENDLTEFSNYTPYLNKLFSSKVLFNHIQQQSLSQQHTTDNNLISSSGSNNNNSNTCSITNIINDNLYTNKKHHDSNVLLSTTISLFPTHTTYTTGTCSSINENNSNHNKNYTTTNTPPASMDYEKFQPNDYKLLSEKGLLKTMEHHSSSSSSSSSSSTFESRDIKYLNIQILNDKIQSSSSPPISSSHSLIRINEMNNSNIIVTSNNSLYRCIPSIHPPTVNVYSQVINSTHSKQPIYPRISTNDLSIEHPHFHIRNNGNKTGNNNVNNNPYPFSGNLQNPHHPPPPPPHHHHHQQLLSRSVQNSNNTHLHHSVYLNNGHLRNFNQTNGSSIGHTNHHGFTYGLDGTRRKNATRESTTTLKVWLQEHMKNPYPTKGEKIMLAIITKMTLTQVSTWFANARRRLKKENKMSWPPKSIGSNNSIEQKSPINLNSAQNSNINHHVNNEKSIEHLMKSTKKLQNNQDLNEDEIILEGDDDDDHDEQIVEDEIDGHNDNEDHNDDDDDDNNDDDDDDDDDDDGDDDNEQNGNGEFDEDYNDIVEGDLVSNKHNCRQNYLSSSHHNFQSIPSFLSHSNHDSSICEQSTNRFNLNIIPNERNSELFHYTTNTYLTSSSQTLPHYSHLSNVHYDDNNIQIGIRNSHTMNEYLLSNSINTTTTTTTTNNSSINSTSIETNILSKLQPQSKSFHFSYEIPSDINQNSLYSTMKYHNSIHSTISSYLPTIIQSSTNYTSSIPMMNNTTNTTVNYQHSNLVSSSSSSSSPSSLSLSSNSLIHNEQIPLSQSINYPHSLILKHNKQSLMNTDMMYNTKCLQSNFC
ncbi:unnamed protein product [Schistosoma curassoni]|nr:unnamed protein product [Schistosoma curassoni]